jgi:type I restriction enzyme, S subunit
MMVETMNRPEIRFKGFNKEWSLSKLRDISDINGGGTPSTSIKEYWGGDIDWYSPTEIGKTAFANGSVKKITPLGLEKSSAKILPANKTVLFTSRAGIGDMAILLKDGATNQGFQSFVLKSGNEPYFVYSAGTLIKKYALKFASGSTFLEISSKQLGNIDLYVPDTKEQSKIGSYFQNLDKLITLHKKKHDKLVNIKKAMLEKMFPQNGADVPEIRFKEFSGAWEEKKLGEIFSYERPNNYIVKTVEYSDDYKTPVLTANKAFILGFTNETNTFNEPSIIFDDFTLDCKYVDFPYMVKSSALKILTIKDENENDLVFAYNLLNSTKFEIMGHARHYISIVQPTIILVPKADEQKKIAGYFSNLDKLITMQQEELEKLKNIKKACLEKMFV